MAPQRRFAQGVEVVRASEWVVHSFMGWLRACGVGTTVGTALQRSFWDDLELCLSKK